MDGGGDQRGAHRFSDAAAAALGVQREIGGWCEQQGIDPPLVLKIGVHHGPAIAVTANDRLDYFGRTVNMAARVGAESEGGDVVFLREAFEEVSPSSELRTLPAEPFKARLRGLEGERELVRVRVAGRAAPGSRRRASA